MHSLSLFSFDLPRGCNKRGSDILFSFLACMCYIWPYGMDIRDIGGSWTSCYMHSIVLSLHSYASPRSLINVEKVK